MVYPEMKTKGFVSRALDYFKGDSPYIPDHDSMQEKALEVYLDTCRAILVDLRLSYHLNVVQIAKEIIFIFKQLYSQNIAEKKEIRWIATKLPVVSL